MEFLRYRSEDVRTALLFFLLFLLLLLLESVKSQRSHLWFQGFSSIYSSFILGGYRSNEKLPLE